MALFSAATLRADNDSFADARDLDAVTVPRIEWVGGTGTAEPGEPAHAGSPAAHSYWFKWTATATTACIFREFLNGSGSRIAIYTGNTVSTLTLVAQGTQRVYFPVTAGVVYHIAIDSPSQDVIQFKPYPVGGADAMAAAQPITGTLPLRVDGNNALATASPTDEDWHPEWHPNATVWWVWTAPSSGAIRLDARYCDFGTRLTVMERPPGGSANRIALGLQASFVPVTAGRDYLFCIDATGDPGQIGFWLEWFPTTAPPNDNIANATNLGSAKIACDGGWLPYATAEAGLPNEDIGYPQWGVPGDRTLWWSWTCPQTGTYRFSHLGGDSWPTLNLYTGTPSSLSLVTGTEDPNGVRLATTAGTTYWIQIRDWKKTAVRTELNIHPALNETPYFKKFASTGVFRLFGSQRLPDADPDGDGFSNEIEFACGANPEIHNPDDPNLPHLFASPNGGYYFLWGEDKSYTGNSSGLPVPLNVLTTTNPAGPWTTDVFYTDPFTGRNTTYLPFGPRAFSRLALTDPNWEP